jgi:transposase-like protein
MTTKSDRIRALYAEGKSVAEIAEIVGCRPEYVRVAARQRAGGKRGVADVNYRPRIMEAWAVGDRNAARSAGREAYRVSRVQGETVSSAAKKYGGAYSSTLVATGVRMIREAAE